MMQKQQNIEELILIGGGAKGQVWLQILADIWQKRIVVPAYREEATSMGAAICGGVGIGMYPDFLVAEKLNRTVSVIEPNAENRARYETLYSIFNDTYTALEAAYDRLAAYREQFVK